MPAKATHGHTRRKGERSSATYTTWRAMKARCLNPNHPDYLRYGGRGITVCARWLDFAEFLADMGERPEGYTLDRADPDAGYDPVNCRWATYSEQRRNQRVATCGRCGVGYDEYAADCESCRVRHAMRWRRFMEQRP